MAEGHNRDAWAHTSRLVAMIHNVNASRQNRKPPAYFNPTIDDPVIKATAGEVGAIMAKGR